MSIRLRLTAWYTGILAVTLILFSASIFGLVQYKTYEVVKKRIEEQAFQIYQSQSYTVSQGLDLSLSRQQVYRLEEARMFVQIHNYTSGSTRFSDNLLRSGMKFPVPSIEELGKSNKFENMTVEGKPFVIYEIPYTVIDNDRVVGLIQIAASTSAEENLMNQMGSVLIIGSMITIIVASTLGMFLARKSMRPIEKVIEGTNQIQTGNDLSVRIDYQGPNDEIGRLIGTVNNMLARMEGFYKELEEAYATQRRFVSDASHELRTPLTTIRGNVELLQKMWVQERDGLSKMNADSLNQISLEAVSDIADESQRMSRLINDMLSLARSDQGQTFTKEMIPLAPLVEEVVRRAQLLPRTVNWVAGDLSVLENVYVDGSKDYLQQMLFIFIENAFKYTPQGQVSIDVVSAGEQVGIRIADTGIGMDRSEVPHIFERFYRADPSRGITKGSGLGLSIAKWIIDEHGGSVEVLTKSGEGTTFIIWLQTFPPTIQ